MSDEKFIPRKRITGASKKAPVKEEKIEIKINDEVNKNNKLTFDKYFKKEVLKSRYSCVVCDKETSIDTSYSNNGNKLICLTCVNKNFFIDGKLNIKKLKDWLGK